MPRLLDTEKLIDDEWIKIGDDEVIEEDGPILVSLTRLKRDWEQLDNGANKIGVELQATDNINEIQDYLFRLDLVELRFVSFADGRAFSQARLLRERYGYAGDIRAVGDVIRDQLSFMHRCGFNQFQLADGEDPDLALKAFVDFSETYQLELN